MLRNQCVVHDVHEEVGLREFFQAVFRRHGKDYLEKVNSESKRHLEPRRTLRAEGVIFPGKTMIPRWMDFSSNMLRSLWRAEPIWAKISLFERNHKVLSHGFNANAFLIWEEHKNLVGRIWSRRSVEIQLLSTVNVVRVSNLGPHKP